VEYWSPAGRPASFYLVLVAATLFSLLAGLFIAGLAGFWLLRGVNACLLAFEAFLPSSRGTGRWFFGCDRIAPPVL